MARHLLVYGARRWMIMQEKKPIQKIHYLAVLFAFAVLVVVVFLQQTKH
jgi:hypothetical protein